jgi:hypothetical protein
MPIHLAEGGGIRYVEGPAVFRNRSTSDGKQADANGSCTPAPRTDLFNLVTLEPGLMHCEEHLSTLSQELFVRATGSAVERVRGHHSRKLPRTAGRTASAKVRITGLRHSVERGKDLRQ